MMNKFKNSLMTTLWFLISLLPALLLPVAYVFRRTGVMLAQAINKWMDYCIAKLEKYEGAE